MATIKDTLLMISMYKDNTNCYSVFLNSMSIFIMVLYNIVLLCWKSFELRVLDHFSFIPSVQKRVP